MRRVFHLVIVGLVLAVLTVPLFAQQLLTRGDGIIGRVLVGPTAGSYICIMAGAGAPTNGTSGTGVGRCGPGSVYADVTNKTIYNNTNTMASPTWELTGGNQVVRYASVTLTNAQVLALNTTPITLVSAPGTGLVVEIIGAVLSLNYTATYSNGSDLMLYYGSRTTGNAASAAITAASFLTSVTANTVVRVSGTPSNTLMPTTSTAVAVQQVDGTAFTGGNTANTLKIQAMYRTLNIP